jgi:hypothetical protein
MHYSLPCAKNFQNWHPLILDGSLLDCFHRRIREILHWGKFCISAEFFLIQNGFLFPALQQGRKVCGYSPHVLTLSGILCRLHYLKLGKILHFGRIPPLFSIISLLCFAAEEKTE